MVEIISSMCNLILNIDLAYAQWRRYLENAWGFLMGGPNFSMGGIGGPGGVGGSGGVGGPGGVNPPSPLQSVPLHMHNLHRTYISCISQTRAK